MQINQQLHPALPAKNHLTGQGQLQYTDLSFSALEYYSLGTCTCFKIHLSLLVELSEFFGGINSEFGNTVFHRHLILGFVLSNLTDFLLYMLTEIDVELFGCFGTPVRLMNRKLLFLGSEKVLINILGYKGSVDCIQFENTQKAVVKSNLT